MTLSNRQLFLDHMGQTSSAPSMLEIERADAIYFYTPDGERYIDLVSGVSVSALGHNHPHIRQAVKEQLDRHMHLMVYGELVQSPQVQYARWIAGHLPGDLESVYFVNSGSEAIEGAMKLAKRVTGRPEIIAFNKAYHGSTHGALSILGDKTFHSGYLPLLPGIGHIDFNEEAGLDRIGNNTAAVIVEVIQAEAGIIEAKESFLSKLRKRCSETGALLVFDEIQTGFGRTGKLFAFQHYNIEPDIICFAKSFGGGMPLGAFVSSRERMLSLTSNPALGHITTFGGHPVSCAAGLAAQEFLVQNKLPERALELEKLYRSLMVHEDILEIRGKGLFLAVEFSERIDPVLLMQNIFQNKIILDQFLFSDSSFRIAPPLIITEEEVKKTAELLLDAIRRSRK